MCATRNTFLNHLYPGWLLKKNDHISAPALVKTSSCLRFFSSESQNKKAKSWFLLETSPPGAARSSLRSILRLNSLMGALTLWPPLCSLCLQLFLNSFTWSCSCVSITPKSTEASVADCASVNSLCLFVPACVWYTVVSYSEWIHLLIPSLCCHGF